MGGGTGYTRDFTDSLKATAIHDGYAATDSLFTRDADIRSGKVKAETDESLDPSKMKGGIRESRDIDGKNSHAVAVCLDVTGSMRETPKIVLDQIPGLLGAIIKNGALEHPQVLFSAVGDVNYDDAPFQVGQFEFSNALDSDLSKFYLEGRGGGNSYESYDAFMHFLAYNTSIDCFEKRGEKGYAFLIEDEPQPSLVYKHQMEELFGSTPMQADMSFSDLCKLAQEKWNIFILRPIWLGWGKDANNTKAWEKNFPDHVIALQAPDGICALIAMLIANDQGVDLDAVADVLKSEGTSEELVLAARKAATKGGEIATTGTISGISLTKGSGSNRL